MENKHIPPTTDLTLCETYKFQDFVEGYIRYTMIREYGISCLSDPKYIKVYNEMYNEAMEQYKDTITIDLNEEAIQNLREKGYNV